MIGDPAVSIERVTGTCSPGKIHGPGRAAILSRAGIAISAVIVAFAAWKVDWRQTGLTFSQADGYAVAFGAALFIMSFVFFAMRWRSLCIGGEGIPRPTMFAYQMIGYMANAILPLRPGDLVRVLLVRQRHGVGAVHGVASIALERLIDIGTILLVGLIISLFVSLPTTIIVGIAAFSVIACLALFGLLALSVGGRVSLIGHLGSLVPQKFRIRVGQLRAALQHVADLNRAVAMVMMNCAGWICLFAGATVLLFGLHVPAPWFSAPLVLVVTSLGSAIPSSPGSLGVYHALVVLTLAIWGVAAPVAVAYAILVHSLAIGLHVLLGACSILITRTASLLRDTPSLNMSKLMDTPG
jgi:uncharacterized protein (TIRG00374 family)